MMAYLLLHIFRLFKVFKMMNRTTLNVFSESSVDF